MGIKGYKGFDKDLKCKNFQFKIGETYQADRVKICEYGFHFCENGLDVISYYEPSSSIYCEVEGDGKIEKHDNDSKVACSKLHVKAEISLSTLIGAGVKFILDKVDWTNKKESNTGYRSAATNTGNRSAATNTGYRSAATNTGNRSAATNTGYQSAATNTGNRSAASVSGKHSVACGLGIECKAKASIGSWLVIAERELKDEEWQIKTIKTACVDGKKIKPDTWYMVKDGKFVEVICEN